MNLLHSDADAPCDALVKTKRSAKNLTCMNLRALHTVMLWPTGLERSVLTACMPFLELGQTLHTRCRTQVDHPPMVTSTQYVDAFVVVWLSLAWWRAGASVSGAASSVRLMPSCC